jgi:predicted DNA binding protein
MSVFGEFRVPTDALVLAETFTAEPALVIDIDRVVATDEEYLTPYFVATGVSNDAFESVAREDDSIGDLQRVHESDGMTMYLAEWRDHVEALAYSYTRDGASILKATGSTDGWLLRMRFDARENIAGFTDHLRERGFSFDLVRLHERSYARPGSKFGLTPKQYETLVTAWEMGYFDLPRDTSMTDVAAKLGISTSSLSDRLRRAQHTLIGDTLRVSVGRNPRK